MTKEQFSVRAFVALVIALTGITLPVSGIANHLYGFSPLSVERHAWMAGHNVLGALFTSFSVWHVVLNRRVLLRHLRGALPAPAAVGREALLAVAVVAAALFVFVGHAFVAGGRS